MSIKLIVALDFDNPTSALALIKQLNPETCVLKVGLEMFTLLGPDFVRHLIKKQFKIFLDLKFHDIPNTVARSCRAGAELGVWMMNVHASGGLKMMTAAREVLEPFGPNRPLLIAVTVLTSMGEDEFSAIGIHKDLEEQVGDLARLAQQAGLDGIVCSALETPAVKKSCGSNFLTITPGIRLPEDSKYDQTRIMTPERAIQDGSDYLVIGRPITCAARPYEVVMRILSAIQSGPYE